MQLFCEATPSSDQSLHTVKIFIMTPNCPPESCLSLHSTSSIFHGILPFFCETHVFKSGYLEMSWSITFLPLPSLSFSCLLFFFLLSLLPFSFLPPFPSIQSSACAKRLFHSGQCAVTALNGLVSPCGDENGFHACLPRPQEEILQALSCV